MKKIILYCIAFFILSSSYAQELENKIPAHAFAVATIKGDKIFKLMFLQDIDSSFLGKNLLQKASKETGKPYESIADFGLNLDKNLYYFSLRSDSIDYNCYLIPLEDAKKFDALLNTKDKEIVFNGEQRSYILRDSSGLIIWDNQKALYITGTLNKDFLRNTENATRFGLKMEDHYYSQPVEVISSSHKYDDDEQIEESPKSDSKFAEVWETDTIEVENSDPVMEAVDMVAEAADLDLDTDEDMEEVEIAEAQHIVEVVMDDDYNDQPSDYKQNYQSQRAIRKRLLFNWTQDMASTIFNKEIPSIKSNKSFTANTNKHAVASLWVSNLNSLYTSMMTGVIPSYGLGMLGGFGRLNLDLFMDKKEVRIKTNFAIDKLHANSYRKMMKNKLNRKFFQYVDSKNLIGFGSFVVNTQAYLEEFPNLLKQTYGWYLGNKYAEVIDVGGDLFSLLLDEKAVGKVIKGDALWILKEISEKEVTYTTYNYDEEYTKEKVQKTKTETQPEFLFLFSSDDMRIIKKLLDLGISENQISLKDNIYKIKYRKSPFDVYLTMKDGIVIMGNSFKDLQQISNNQFRASISKGHKKLLKKSNFTLLFNAKNLAGKIPDSSIGNQRKAEQFNSSLNAIENIYMKSNSLKNNIISAELIAEVPEDQENALKYLFFLIKNTSDL